MIGHKKYFKQDDLKRYNGRIGAEAYLMLHKKTFFF